MSNLSIREVATRTGVTETTLRAWEHRHGFPSPERLAGGHRRYSEQDVEDIRTATALRDTGLPLALAIARAKEPRETPRSIHAQLRSDHPELVPQLLSREMLLALTHAIEDETCARAERPVMFGSFQREQFYRSEEPRWQQFARTAEIVCVFADFKRTTVSRRCPAELPIDEEDRLTQEWSIVCDAPGFGVCLSGWEPPHNFQTPSKQRVFETIWSVDPRIVRSAAKTCAAIARASIPEQIDALADHLDSPALPATGDQLRLAAAITSRTLAYLS